MSGFRCKNCDALLTHSDEFDLDECRECRDRLWLHLFDESDDGTCRACGFLERMPVHREVSDVAV